MINAIRKEDGDRDALLRLSYHEHLWLEREVRSVANVTAGDVRDCLRLAAAIPLRPEVQCWPLARANEALRELKRGRARGARVLVVATDGGR